MFIYMCVLFTNRQLINLQVMAIRYHDERTLDNLVVACVHRLTSTLVLCIRALSRYTHLYIDMCVCVCVCMCN